MKIIECPRDAMQGLKEFIPTNRKIEYLNQLLKVGFDTIDCGSFVSPKAMPQMRDTAEVIKQLEWDKSTSRLLVIVANKRGCEEACAHEAVTYLGYPMSISETFQKRNTNRSITEALNDLESIIELAHRSAKKVVAYISMGFGNPYGDPYGEDIVVRFAEILNAMGADVISLADTIGASSPVQITSLFTAISGKFPKKEIGAHLHSTPQLAQRKIKAAFEAGCRRMDGAIKGYGGCPMADDDLVGNIATEVMLDFLADKGFPAGINEVEFKKALVMASEIFPNR